MADTDDSSVSASLWPAPRLRRNNRVRSLPQRHSSSSRLSQRVMLVGRAVHPVRLNRLLVGEVEVAQEDLDTGMAHQLLERPDVRPIAQHAHGEGVAEPVRVDA